MSAPSRRTATSTVPPAATLRQPALALVRARPYRAIAVFVAVHLGIDWLCLPPAYWFFSAREGASTGFLLGPLVGTLSKVPLPGFVPFTGGATTFGQLLELVIESSVRVVGRAGWAVGAWGLSKRKSSAKEGEREAEKALDRARDGGLRAKVGSLSSSVHTRHVLDAVAAYALVKTLLPLRLAASLGLTPVLLRLLAR